MRFSAIKAILAAGLFVLPGGFADPWVAAAQQAATSPLLVKDLTPETRGDLLMIHRSYQAAIDAYIACPDQSAEILNKIGIAYHHLYAIDKARVFYLRALQFDPKFADALNNLGATYYAGQDFKKAEQYYRRALKIAPRNVTFRKNLGAAYFAQGKTQKGMEAYRDAFEDDPNAFSDNVSNLISEPGTARERWSQDYCLAALYARAGMNTRALDYLREAFSAGFSDYKKLKTDSDFDTLRKSTEYAELVKDERR